MSNSSAPELPTADAVVPKEIRIIVVGEVALWTPQVQEYIEKSFEYAKILACPGVAQIDGFLLEADLVSLLFQPIPGRDSSESTRKILALISATQALIKKGTASLSLITTHIPAPSLVPLEKRGVIQIIRPDSHVKALRVKLEYSLARMRVAFEKNCKKDQPDFLIKSKGVEQSPDFTLSEARPLDTPNKNYLDKRSPLALAPDTRSHLLLISERSEDLALGASLSKAVGANFHVFGKISGDIYNFLTRYPKAIVLWDVAVKASYQQVSELLAPVIDFSRVFALSDQRISQLPHISSLPNLAFAHNLVRHNSAAATEIYARLIDSALADIPPSLNVFFPDSAKNAKRQKICLTHSSQFPAAVNATKNFLEKQGLSNRLANQAAQMTGELLLNAILKAPVDADGKHYRENLDLSEALTLLGKEEITLEVMSDDYLFAVSVRDQFGSIDLKNALPDIYKRSYRNDHYVPEDNQMKLGLCQASETGFSLFLSSIKGKMTEATLFFLA